MCFFLEVGVEVAVVGEEKNRNRNYYAPFFFFILAFFSCYIN